RRHTRSKRDWSSDVCSSDLLRLAVLQNCEGALVEVRDHVLLVINHGGVEHDLLRARVKDEATALRTGFLARGGWWSLRRLSRARSEERRVGKEGRWGWGRDA